MTSKRVLVVEDEMLLALSLEDILTDIGCETIGPAMHLEEALALAETDPLDFAILDINLGGAARSDAVARRLQERKVPFLFMSGYGDAGVTPDFASVPVLGKPASPELVAAAVRRGLNK
jgi:two-component SAPR family response regulator